MQTDFDEGGFLHRFHAIFCPTACFGQAATPSRLLCFLEIFMGQHTHRLSQALSPCTNVLPQNISLSTINRTWLPLYFPHHCEEMLAIKSTLPFRPSYLPSTRLFFFLSFTSIRSHFFFMQNSVQITLNTMVNVSETHFIYPTLRRFSFVHVFVLAADAWLTSLTCCT